MLVRDAGPIELEFLLNFRAVRAPTWQQRSLSCDAQRRSPKAVLITRPVIGPPFCVPRLSFFRSRPVSPSTSTRETSRWYRASQYVGQLGVDTAVEARAVSPRIPAPRPAESMHAPASALGSSLRILVVDDNRDSAVSLSILLSLTGHETTTAFDGEEALDTAGRFEPDVVLLDIGLPKLNGYQVCRALRAVPRERRLVIVALTGWGQAADRRKSMEAGFDAHLVKPVDPDALQRTLRQLIA